MSEAAPTTDVRLQGVQVSLGDSRSTTTDSKGEFRFSDVPAGNYDVRASQGGYVAQTRSLGVSGDSSVSFDLLPVEQTIERTASGKIGQDDDSCRGSSHPCRIYAFAVHYDGTVSANLEWVSSDADLELELRCNDQIVAVANSPGNVVGEALEFPVTRGQRCELRVNHLEGPDQEFTLQRSHPN